MPKLVSILIPLYNEEAVCSQLVSALEETTSKLPNYSFEYIFVNDGSSDRTLQILSDFAKVNPKISVLSLSRNFGHQAALAAAVDYARGDAAIVMDGDLQDPPSAIEIFLKHFEEGNDVVYATRASRKEAWHLKASYRLFYLFLGKVSNCNIPIDSGDFSLMSRKVLDVIKSTRESNRFTRGLRAWAGFRQIAIPIDRPKRLAGKSKYDFGKLLALALDGIFSFSVFPLRIAAAIGFLTVFFSSIFLGYFVFAKFYLQEPPTGFTATIVSILFTAGVQLIFLGIIGEYVGRIYEETKSRPLYVIDKIVKS